MKWLSSKRRLLAVVAVVVLLLFLVRPGATRLKARIAASISAGVGRPVEIGSVHIRLLPRPGFDLENLVVHEDPAFGSEPMLRASEVTAALRLTSLVRGHLEIARLNLTEPSLNLVRAENGRWNLEALVERAEHASLAPTAKTKSEARPGFPYIECSSGRINFKIGQEKKAYALTNADFALWQDSENDWGVRLEAQPFRSDLNLSDTGMLRVNGAWHRAASLRDTPLQFTVEWNRPQLGQLTKFFTGTDQGWRGQALADASISGTPAELKIIAAASVRDFRRYDVVGGEALRLGTRCTAEYSSIDRMVHGLDCRAPVGEGMIRLEGDFGSIARHNYELKWSAENVPAGALIALARTTKRSLPDDLAAQGTITGGLVLRGGGSAEGTAFEGNGKIANLHLTSANNKAEFALGNIPFAFVSVAGKESRSTRKKTVAGLSIVASNSASAGSSSEPHIEIGPFPVALGRPKSALVQAWVNRSGCTIKLAGNTDVAKTERLARLFGLAAPKATAEGEAMLDLQVATTWAGWIPKYGAEAVRPSVTGTAQLKNVRAKIRGTSSPVEISSAQFQILPDEIRITKLNAIVGATNWTGTMDIPRGCQTAEACMIRFDLGATAIDLSELRQWVAAPQKQRPWYKLLERTEQSGPSFFSTLHAVGKLNVARVSTHTVTATHVSADAALNDGKLNISNLSADFLGGKYRANWKVDFSAKPPTYASDGELKDVALTQLGVFAKDAGLAGTAQGTYQLNASGTSVGDFWQQAEGTLQFDLREASLARLSLANELAPLKITHWQGHARIHDGKIEIKDGQLNSPAGTFQVKGTASLRRDLDLKLIHSSAATQANASGYSISGTLAQPHVIANPETQAKLKQQ